MRVNFWFYATSWGRECCRGLMNALVLCQNVRLNCYSRFTFIELPLWTVLYNASLFCFTCGCSGCCFNMSTWPSFLHLCVLTWIVKRTVFSGEADEIQNHEKSKNGQVRNIEQYPNISLSDCQVFRVKKRDSNAVDSRLLNKVACEFSVLLTNCRIKWLKGSWYIYYQR